LAGEVELLYKIVICYENKKYESCNEIFFERQMTKMPHFIANFYRAKALFSLGQKSTAKEFLGQSLYKHDYTKYGQEVIKNLLFSED
jgi:hypothetical protein